MQEGKTELLRNLDDMRMEIGKLTGLLETLQIQAKKEQVDRNECKILVSRFRASLTNFKECLTEVIQSFERQESESHQADIFSFIKSLNGMFQTRKFEDSLDPLISKINLEYQLDDSKNYSDKQIQSRLLEFSRDLDVLIATLNRKIFKRMKSSIGGFSRISEFVGEELANLDENWVAANAYLSAIEITVNKKLAELNINKKGMSFDQRFEALIESLEDNGTKITEIEKQLTPAFWDIRNKVIHEGYSPSQKELDLVIEWSKTIVRKLR